MSLTSGLRSAKELLEKLHRDAALLDDEVSSDRFYNFAVTGYSMVDWVRNDPTVPAAAKTQPEIDGLRNNRWIQICGDIATANKHFTLNQRVPITGSVSAEQGWGQGRWGKGGWGEGEQSIDIVLTDGTQVCGLELVLKVVKEWDLFFQRHGI